MTPPGAQTWAAAAICLLLSGAPAAAAAPRAPKAAAEYRVEVEVDLAAGRYRGRQTVRYQNRATRPIRDLYFRLYPNVGLAAGDEPLLKVTSVTIGGRAAAVRDDGSGLQVKLPAELNPGRTAEAVLEFEGRAVGHEPADVDLNAHVTDQVSVVLSPMRERPRRGADLLTRAGDAMLLGSPFPVLAVHENGRWRQGEAVGAGDFVFSEAADYDIAVKTSCGTRVVASAGVGSTGDSGSSPTCDYAFRGAGLRGVALFAYAGMAEEAREAEGVRLVSIHTPDHAPAARRALEAAAGAVAVYADLFGEPPYKEVTLVEAPLPPGTPGLAYSGLVALASAYYTDVRGEEGRSLPGFIRDTPDLMDGALELEAMRQVAHMWWGEAVGSDPVRSPYLDEALASYSTVVAVERLQGPEARERAVEQQLRTPYRVFRMFGGQDEPVGGPADRFANYFGYAAIVQAKGGMWLATLRAGLGDDRFFDGLRRYYKAHSGRIAAPQDLLWALGRGDRAARARVARSYDRWVQQRHGDADVGEPEYAVQVPAGVAEGDQTPERRSVFDRFGRFIVRKMAQFGKTAAKPF